MPSYFVSPFDTVASPYDDPYSRNKRDQRQQPYGEYSPQDELTALEMAKGTVSSGMELFSDIMDTFGGRAIRGGILGGKPRELLSVLPFSDWAGITDETQKVSGQDLAKQWGIAGGDRWGDMATGIGIDALFDPSTYMFGPGAALGKAGQIAKAAGMLPRTVRARQAGTLAGELIPGAGKAGIEMAQAVASGRASPLGLAGRQSPALHELLGELGGTLSAIPRTKLARASEAAKGLGLDLAEALPDPLGGLIGFGLPLTKAPLAVAGTGEYASQLANWLGKGTDWLGMTPPALALRAMFNKDVESRLSKPLQEGFLRVAPRMAAAEEAGNRYGLNLERQLDEFGMSTPVGHAALGKAITEEQPSMILGQVAARVRADQAAERAAMDAVGIGVGELEQYLSRSKYQFEPTPGFEAGGGLARGLQGISPFSPHLQGRVEPFASRRGTGEAVDLMFQDPRITSPFRTLAEPGQTDLARETGIIRTEFLKWTPQQTREYGNLLMRKTTGQEGPFQLTPDEITALAAGGRKATEVYGPYRLTDLEELRFKELDKLWKEADQWAPILARADPKYPALSATGPTGEATLPFYNPDVVKGAAQYKTRAEQVKLRAEGIMYAVGKDAKNAADAPLDWISVDEVFKKIGMTGSGAEGTLAKMMSGLKTFTGETLPNLKISRPLAKDLENYITPFTRPTALDPFIKIIDTVQTIFKAGVTAVWPKKYIRDAVQGGYMNFSAMNPAEFARYQTAAAMHVKKGGVIEFANQVPGFEHFTPEQATIKLADEFASLDGFYTGRKSRFAEEIGGAGFVPKVLPGKGREGIKEIFTPDAERPTTWNWKDIAGIWGREETKFAPVVAGGKLSELIDDTNKFALFLQRRMSGYSTGAAWEDVIKRHYDYTNLAGFEHSVMRRIFPFYSWMRQNVPNTLKRLIDQPGGAEALTAKAFASQRAEEFIPEHVGEGLAIPLSAEDAGVQRFLSRSGLQFEDALKVLGDIGNIKTLGQLTPLLKVPLEFATGTQLHTGRPLADVNPITGNRIFDEILSNSGLPGRAYTTARPLLMPFTDKREFSPDDLLKFGVNAIAPVSITDVNMAQQRQRAIREVIEDKLRGSADVGNVERFYVKPENLQRLTPEQLLLLRVYSQQQQAAQDKKRIGVKKRSSEAQPVLPYNLD